MSTETYDESSRSRKCVGFSDKDWRFLAGLKERALTNF